MGDTGVTLKQRNLGPLHDLLLEACPPGEGDVKSIPVLAGHLGCSSYAIYKWIDNGKISGPWAKKVIDLSDGRVTEDDFNPYVYV